MPHSWQVFTVYIKKIEAIDQKISIKNGTHNAQKVLSVLVICHIIKANTVK